MDIVRIKETRWEELFRLTIFGLRIAHVNEGTEYLEDPMITFLRQVLMAYPCAAHMSRDPWLDDPVETFSAFYTKDRFVPTSVGVYCHATLFSGCDRPYGAFFPRFLPDDLSVLDENKEPLIDDLLALDQPMLYLNVNENVDARLAELFSNPPEESDHFDIDWLRNATSLVPLVLVGGHDESCFHAFSRVPEHFKLLDKPLQNTEKAIRESEWFQANSAQLQWSDKVFEWCLVFPDGVSEQHRKCE